MGTRAPRGPLSAPHSVRRHGGDRSIPGDTSASQVPPQAALAALAAGERGDGQQPPRGGQDTSLVLLARVQAGRSGGQEEGRAAQAAVGQELGAQRVEDVGEEEAPPDIFGGLVGEGRAGVQRGAHVGELSLGTQGRGWHGGGPAATGWPGAARPAPKGVSQEHTQRVLSIDLQARSSLFLSK